MKNFSKFQFHCRLALELWKRYLQGWEEENSFTQTTILIWEITASQTHGFLPSGATTECSPCSFHDGEDPLSGSIFLVSTPFAVEIFSP